MTNKTAKHFHFKKWFLAYTILFLLLSLIIWRPFYLSHKSMIWGYDGLYQTYGTMVYFSNYWKAFLSNLFSGTFCLPMADTSVGLGFDILTTLNYYGFGDPLLWLSLLFPQEQMEVCYNLLVFLRYFLAGLTFGIYCWNMEKKSIPTLGGAFVYIFCGFALYAGVRHPYFMNPWIYFPLLCLGVEQILKGKKGYLLAVTAGVAACSNFYFFYMLTILTFLYAVIRFTALYHSRWKSCFLKIFLSGCVWFLLGIGLGSIILIPDIFAVLSSARVGSASSFARTWFAYPADFYKQLIAGYLFPVYQADYWCVLVYPIPAFSGLLVLCNRTKERENLWLGIWFVLLSLLLWIPFGGLAMNGFSYVSHRWFFGYSFCIALLFILGVEKAETISKKRLAVYSCFFLASAWLFFKDKSLNGGLERNIGVGFCSLFFIYMLSTILLRSRLAKTAPPKQNSRYSHAKSCFSCVMVLCVIFTAILSSRSLYSDTGAGYTGEFQNTKTSWKKMTLLSEVAAADQLKNSDTAISGSLSKGSGSLSKDASSFSRIEGDTPQETNWGMISNINGANSYFSLTRRELYDYAFDLENPDLKFPSWYNGFGERAALLSLNSVHYFTKMKDGNMAVPYGYIPTQTFQNPEMEGSMVLYESPYSMPIGYTYDQVMSKQDWDSLPALRKQQAFMQAAVLEDDVLEKILTDASSISMMRLSESDTEQEEIREENRKASNTPSYQGRPYLDFQETPLPCTIVSTEGVTWDQNQGLLLVNEGGGEIAVRYREQDNSETYLRICGFDIEESGYEMLHFFAGADGTQEKKIYCTSSVSAWDGKLKNFLVLISGGTIQEDGSQTARIRFPFSGEFKLDNLELYSLPMEAFVKQAERRQQEPLNASLAQNRIQGTIQVSGNRILCVSIPYSDGWTAKVDGQTVPVWKCNDMHLGIPLDQGNHEVVFSYRTPGLLPGAAVSLLSLLILLILFVTSRRSSSKAPSETVIRQSINQAIRNSND